MGSDHLFKKTIPFLDSKNFSDESKTVIDFIAEYYRNIEKYPVRSRIEPGYLSEKLPESAPFVPESLEEVLKDVSESILPGLTHWQSPNFFAYFQANASTAGFLGEMLCSCLNVVGFNWISSPAATELETIVMDWMGKMLKLPSSFLFSGTGVQKSAKLIGITKSNFRVITTSFSTKFALSPKNLRATIEADVKAGLVPLYLCDTVGITACGAVDPIKELGKVAREYEMWFHIDANYAGSACICPEYRPYLDGVEFSDSICLNPHKWFLTNMDCCYLWLKKPKILVDSLSTDSEILRNKASESHSVIDYKDWQIALSRRFKALKLWIVIRKHGLTNLMYHIRSDVDMAKRFEAMVATDRRFEIVVLRKFALVCFMLKPELESDGSELNQKLLEAVNSSGRAFMSHAVVGGLFVIRAAIGATLTEDRHVDDLWKLILEKAQILQSQDVN
ncbi:hypothetical protein LWI28_022017 [Acer negundo]|uniref:Uncharacterized protein n=1 Tax=Acer negundo TaxID=4023 RepID=A0AAD5JEW6_ACENE|nr:hypothetical protein LWI28_022017 [Acer negundo]